MIGMLESLFDFDWDVMLAYTVQMVLAFGLVLPVGV